MSGSNGKLRDFHNTIDNAALAATPIAARNPAEVVSQDCFVDHVTDNLGVGLGDPILAKCDIAECVEAKFENIVHRSLFCSRTS